MAQFSADSEVLAAKSDSLKTIATQISNLTNDMRSEMNKLKSGWIGEAGEGTVKRFMSLHDTFEDIYNGIKAYSTFLREAAEVKRLGEKNRREAASSLAGK